MLWSWLNKCQMSVSQHIKRVWSYNPFHSIGENTFFLQDISIIAVSLERWTNSKRFKHHLVKEGYKLLSQILDKCFQQTGKIVHFLCLNQENFQIDSGLCFDSAHWRIREDAASSKLTVNPIAISLANKKGFNLYFKSSFFWDYLISWYKNIKHFFQPRLLHCFLKES